MRRQLQAMLVSLGQLKLARQLAWVGRLCFFQRSPSFVNRAIVPYVLPFVAHPEGRLIYACVPVDIDAHGKFPLVICPTSCLPRLSAFLALAAENG